jgi:hypothetical protein
VIKDDVGHGKCNDVPECREQNHSGYHATEDGGRVSRILRYLGHGGYCAQPIYAYFAAPSLSPSISDWQTSTVCTPSILVHPSQPDKHLGHRLLVPHLCRRERARDDVCFDQHVSSCGAQNVSNACRHLPICTLIVLNNTGMAARSCWTRHTQEWLSNRRRKDLTLRSASV